MIPFWILKLYERHNALEVGPVSSTEILMMLSRFEALTILDTFALNVFHSPQSKDGNIEYETRLPQNFCGLANFL